MKDFTLKEKIKGKTKEMEALFNKEAIRVVKSLPDFKPGKKDGKPVKVAMEIPIMFKLK